MSRLQEVTMKAVGGKSGVGPACSTSRLAEGLVCVWAPCIGFGGGVGRKRLKDF